MHVDTARQELSNPPSVDWRAMGWETVVLAALFSAAYLLSLF